MLFSQDHGGEGGVAADVSGSENVGGGGGVGGLQPLGIKISCQKGIFEDTNERILHVILSCKVPPHRILDPWNMLHGVSGGRENERVGEEMSASAQMRLTDVFL